MQKPNYCETYHEPQRVYTCTTQNSIFNVITVACIKTLSPHACVLCNFLTTKLSYIYFLVKVPLITLSNKIWFQC